MKYKLLSLMAALLTVAVTHQASAQKAGTHKPITKTSPKPVVAPPLKLPQLISIKKLVTVPSADEYLTSRNWRFVGSEPGDSVDVVRYNHKLPSGTIDGRIYIYLCNKSTSGECIEPEIHEGINTQHIFQIGYEVPKNYYEVLQKDVRAALNATSSRLGENSMITTYKYKSLKFVFILDKSIESQTSYYIIYRDIQIGEEPGTTEE